MSFLSLSAQNIRLTSDINKCNAELMFAKNNLNSVTEKIDDLVAYAGSKDKLSNNKDFQQLVAYQFTWDTKKDHLETQLKALESEKKSYDDAVKKEKTCNFWCFG